MAIEVLRAREITHLAGRGPLVVRAERIFTGAGDAPIHDGAVVVIDKRIRYVGPATQAPRPAGANDLRYPGATLLPGLFDMHAHVMGWGGDYWDEYKIWLGPERKLHVLRAAESAAHWLAAGYTTVRDMAVPNPTIPLRQAIRSGVIEGPRIIAGIAALSQTGGHADSFAFPIEWERDWTRDGAPSLTPSSDWVKYGGGSKGLMVDGVEGCRRAVRALRREGADYIKLFLDHLSDFYNKMGASADQVTPGNALEFSDAEIDAIVDEAHRRGMHVAAHCASAAGMRRGIERGLDTLEHGIAFDDDIYRLMAARGITLVPTIGNALNVFWPPLEQLSTEQRAQKLAENQERLDRIRTAIRLGVTVIPGSGIGAWARGRGMYAKELEGLVELGMTPQQAVESHTRVAAKVCRLDRDLGTLEVGKLADMIVVGGDPLSDIALMRVPGPKAVFTTARDDDDKGAA